MATTCSQDGNTGYIGLQDCENIYLSPVLPSSVLSKQACLITKSLTLTVTHRQPDDLMVFPLHIHGPSPSCPPPPLITGRQKEANPILSKASVRPCASDFNVTSRFCLGWQRRRWEGPWKIICPLWSGLFSSSRRFQGQIIQEKGKWK